MKKLITTLQFLAWPVVCGVLLAVVFLQYQQLQTLAGRPFTQAPSPASGTTSFAEAIRQAAPSVVSINAMVHSVESVELSAENTLEMALSETPSLGSGVIIDDRGYIVTNLHVVDGLLGELGMFNTEVTLSDGRRTPATVVAWDRSNDLAVLHVNMNDMAPIEIGNEQQLDVGDIVFAIGYPRNIGQSVSQGIVSALTPERNETPPIIQTDAAINPGNSGGALIDTEGKLIGINSSIISESGNSEGIGFATPASIAVTATREMIAEAIEANSGYLGVITGEALNPQSSQLLFGVDHIRGMLVESVDDGGPAERAGIQPGDVITQVGDTQVEDAQNIIMEIRNKKPGDSVQVQVYRNGLPLTLAATLGFGQAVIIEL